MAKTQTNLLKETLKYKKRQKDFSDSLYVFTKIVRQPDKHFLDTFEVSDKFIVIFILLFEQRQQKQRGDSLPNQPILCG